MLRSVCNPKASAAEGVAVGEHRLLDSDDGNAGVICDGRQASSSGGSIFTPGMYLCVHYAVQKNGDRWRGIAGWMD